MTRQARIQAFGAPDVLKIQDVDIGAPGVGEVRLAIHAIGLNRTEITLRSGRSPAKPVLPAKIGFEAAGVVEALGPGVDKVAVGDRVALVPSYSAAQYGLYGEAAIVPVRPLVKIPDGVSFNDAAATWAAFGTAWGGLVHVGDLKAGQTVLIPAASSGVGLAAIQIANRIGARPIALSRTSKKSRELLDNGAAAVIVTTEQDLVAEAKRLTGGAGADLVFDPVGGPTFADLAHATKKSGTLILYGALSAEPTVIPPFEVFGRDLTVRGLALTALTQDDETLAEMKAFVSFGLADRTLRPVIARVFPFEAIADAHRFIEAGEHVGKVIATV
jgi:NADPH:quinone reductase-like Zn-dependent oxidoreductase